MGCVMQDVLKLEMREPVRVDPDRLVELCVSMGEARAEALITTAMEELARGMVAIEDAYVAQNMDVLTRRADLLVKTAENIGMTTFSRVADDVAACGRLKEGVSPTARSVQCGICKTCRVRRGSATRLCLQIAQQAVGCPCSTKGMDDVEPHKA